MIRLMVGMGTTPRLARPQTQTGWAGSRIVGYWLKPRHSLSRKFGPAKISSLRTYGREQREEQYDGFQRAEIHALGKALAIAIVVLEQRPRDVQGFAGLDAMKAAFDRLAQTDIDREMYPRQARVALTGTASRRPLSRSAHKAIRRVRFLRASTAEGESFI
jgi:hypothetical protein